MRDACDGATRDLATATQQAMDAAGRRVAEAGADCVVVATPHGVHVGRHLAVVTAGSAEGALTESPHAVQHAVRIDHELSRAIAAEAQSAALPTVEVSFGGNSPAEAVMPLDWGALIPLWHIGRHAPALPAAVVCPARDLDTDQHVAFGAAVVRAARATGRSVVFVASADQGHGHSAEGPYGFHAESAVFDRRVVDVVRRGDLDELEAMPREDVVAALADSWWQMLMLVGALREQGSPYRTEILAYEAPTYYGMLSALATPVAG